MRDHAPDYLPGERVTGLWTAVRPRFAANVGRCGRPPAHSPLLARSPHLVFSNQTQSRIPWHQSALISNAVKSWHELLAALGDAVPRLRLRPAVDVAAIEAAEAVLGFELPSAYREWLQLADGQDQGGLSVFPFCVWFSPLDEVVADWTRQGRGSEPSQRLVIARHGEDPGCALNLVPGRSGQLLALWDPHDPIVIGTSLSSYFERVALLVQKGELVPRPFDPTGAEDLVTPVGASGIRLVRLTELPG